MKQGACIIGLDGVPISLLQDLAQREVMPTVKDLLTRGTLSPMKSSLPANSASSWNSMITGTNPGTHGVYGFTDFIPGTYTMSFHSSLKLKAQPYWAKTDRKNLIINLPASYPAQPIDGTMITGFVSPQLDKAVHPPELVPWLKETGYQIDVDASLYQESIQLFLTKLTQALQSRIRALDHLTKQPYDDLFLVITGTDRIEHYLWHAYTDKNHPHHQDFLDFYTKVDQAIAHTINKLPEDTPLMMLSDHGMGPIDKALNLNALLRQEGYLFTDTKPRKNYNNIKEATVAFASESSKIYLNHKGRYPRGSVNPRDVETLQDEIVDMLQGLRFQGKNVVKQVHLAKNIFNGPEAVNAPDLVVIPERGFSFKTGLQKQALYEDDFLSGTHTEDDAFLYIKNCDHPVTDPSIEEAIHIFKKNGEKKYAA